jgi:hypothetical protein
MKNLGFYFEEDSHEIGFTLTLSRWPDRDARCCRIYLWLQEAAEGAASSTPGTRTDRRASHGDPASQPH